MRDPLFILCPGWSFSSVVCATIGGHPDAFGLPEVHLYGHETVGDLLSFDMPVFGRPGASSGLKRALAELQFGEQTYETIEAAGKWLRERKHFTSGQMMHMLDEMVGDRLMVDKSPTNSHPERMVRILRDFPNARFLHLTRHPMATSRSSYKAVERRGKLDQKKPEDNEKYWFKTHASILQFSQMLAADQYMLLQGENFLERPDFYLRQICDWLGLSSDDAAVERMMQPELSPFAVIGPKNAQYGNNMGFIKNPHLRVGRPRAESLEGTLEWLEGHEIHFSDQTRSLAYQLGYDT